MNILYLAHRIPYPPNKGDKIRSFHQICHLATRHTVRLACLVDDREDIQHVKTLENYCVSVDAVYRDKIVAKCLSMLALFTNKPLSVAYFYSRELEKKIVKRLHAEKFDAIFVFSSAMAWYVRHVSQIPKIMDFVDVDSEKWRLYASYFPFPFSWLYRREANRLGRYENQVARTFNYSLFISEKEAGLFKSKWLTNEQLLAIVPNGVDLDYFAPDGKSPSCANEPAIVFTGSMDYFANVDAVRYFCREIFPLIRSALPETRFYIVGRNPTRKVRELGSQPNVIVIGAVNDVRPYLSIAKAAVAPVRIARGVQNKVLEAMAMGLPVVGTSHAFQGIEATLIDGIRIADDPNQFAREVVSLLEDAEIRHKCSLQARDYVQRCHRWSNHGGCLDALLERIEQNRPSHIGQPLVVDHRTTTAA